MTEKIETYNLTYECPYCLTDVPDLALHYLKCKVRPALRAREKLLSLPKKLGEPNIDLDLKTLRSAFIRHKSLSDVIEFVL